MSAVCFQNGGTGTAHYADLEPVDGGLLDSTEAEIARSDDEAPADHDRQTENQLLNDGTENNMSEFSLYCSIDNAN